ncbi:MAG: hypothetical protein ACK4SL_02490 [Candidatus Paceibacteria bacterium]
MRLILKVLLLSTTLSNASLAEGTYTPKPLPAHLQDCVDAAIRDLALSDGKRDTIEKLFNKHVDRNGLGYRVWKRAWANGTKKWRAKAIELYIDTLMLVAKDAKAGATVIRVDSRLADHAERGANNGNGLWQIAFSAHLSDGRIVSAGALVTDQCKAVEFIHGTWVGRQIPAALVDAQL